MLGHRLLDSRFIHQGCHYVDNCAHPSQGSGNSEAGRSDGIRIHRPRPGPGQARAGARCHIYTRTCAPAHAHAHMGAHARALPIYSPGCTPPPDGPPRPGKRTVTRMRIWVACTGLFMSPWPAEHLAATASAHLPAHTIKRGGMRKQELGRGAGPLQRSRPNSLLQILGIYNIVPAPA